MNLFFSPTRLERLEFVSRHKSGNAETLQRSPRKMHGLIACVLVILFASLWILAARVSSTQRLVVPVDGDFSRHPEHADRLLRVALDNTDFMPAMDLQPGHKATIELTPSDDGYELVLVGRKVRSSGAQKIDVPDVRVSVNGRDIGNFKAKFPTWNGCSIHAVRFVIPGESVRLANNRVVLDVSEASFSGRMVVTRHPELARIVRMALPITAWLLLAALAWWFGDFKSTWIFPAGLFIVLFAVYGHTLSTMKIAPFADYFFSDPDDFIRPIALGEYTFDAMKHPLFLPVARLLYRPLHALLGPSGALAISVMYSLVGATNAVLAWLVFRRRVVRPRTASLLAVFYAFTFSVWVFSSHIETYIFSTAATNIFLIAMLARDRMGRLAGSMTQATAAAGAALMNPPLLILNVVTFFREIQKRGRSAAVCEIAIGLLVLGGYVCGSRAIREISLASTSHIRAPQDSRAMFGMEVSAFQQYSRAKNFTAFQAGNVIAGQFAYAFSGLWYPCHWSDSLAGLKQITRHRLTGTPAALALAALWIMGLAGLWRDRRLLATTVVLAACVLLPYCAFFWLFNPAEMFLYSAPMVSLLILWLHRGWENIFTASRLDQFLLVSGLVIMLHNAACLATYP